MGKQNDGKTEDDILQNQFTAYLLTAVKRHKISYLRQQERRQRLELPLELYGSDLPVQMKADMNTTLSLLDQIENPALHMALLQARERERYIFLTRILDERSFLELSKELGISYKATTHAYYRFVEKIKKMMGGDEK